MTEEPKTMEIVQKFLRDHIKETLLTFPMWMRFNYLLNTINKALTDGHTEADIDWDKVNELLTTNRNEYDFNFFKRIETIEQLVFTRSDCIAASVCSDGIWQEHTCKDCGNGFCMSYKEVKFYEGKGLHIPKRCKACRDKRKVGK
jgi:hypothetical protein